MPVSLSSIFRGQCVHARGRCPRQSISRLLVVITVPFSIRASHSAAFGVGATAFLAVKPVCPSCTVSSARKLSRPPNNFRLARISRNRLRGASRLTMEVNWPAHAARRWRASRSLQESRPSSSNDGHSANAALTGSPACTPWLSAEALHSDTRRPLPAPSTTATALPPDDSANISSGNK
jgi:hypothetical protein